ncbi:hypothetical protein ASF71_18020 [Deinococcus sp. Leaf326]|nr:hypothetical protein ASF71_18020 [Deinococcus sp. Leaf326]
MLQDLILHATAEGLTRAVVTTWVGLDPTWPTLTALAATYNVSPQNASAAGLQGLRQMRRMQRDKAYHPTAPLTSQPTPELERLLSQLARTDTALTTLDQKRETLRAQRRKLALELARLVHHTQDSPVTLHGYVIDEHGVRSHHAGPASLRFPEGSTGEPQESWDGNRAMGQE